MRTSSELVEPNAELICCHLCAGQQGGSQYPGQQQGGQFPGQQGGYGNQQQGGYPGQQQQGGYPGQQQQQGGYPGQQPQVPVLSTSLQRRCVMLLPVNALAHSHGVCNDSLSLRS